MSPVGEYTFEAGGKPYTFRFSTGAFYTLEQVTGQKFASFLRSLEGGDIGMDDLVAFVRAGLKARHGDMTTEDVLQIIDAYGGPLPFAGGPFAEAVQIAVGRPDGAKTGGKAKAGTKSTG